MTPDRPLRELEGVTTDLSQASLGDNQGPVRSAGGESQPQAFGRYVVRGYLGKGGFGSVYLGYDGQLDRQVAIKVPNQEWSEKAANNFLQEARRIARLRHPGIVSIFDFGIQETAIYLITDYIEGRSLSAFLKEKRPTWQEAATIAAAVADALACAHGQRVVHRDIKPSNILLTADQQPVIIDFGLALTDADATEEQRHMVMGTPHFMSPEQARGEGHRIDGRTDVFSLGAVLYYMLTGRLPFGGSQTREILRQVCDDDPQPPRQLVRDIPKELERICLKALSKRISDRYTTAGDLAEELRRVGGARPAHVDHVAVTQSLPAPTPEAPDGQAPTPESHAVLCAKCGSGNVADSQFCRSCGTSLKIAPTPAAAEPAKTPSGSTRQLGGITDTAVASGSRFSSTSGAESQRRQLTILSCSVFTAAEDGTIDPESLGAMLPHFHEACAGVIAANGGHVAQAAGDRILALFGYPVAFEDAARRAVRAGMDILGALARLNAQVLPRGDALLVTRVGIHTGLVVTGQSSAGGTTRDLALVSEPKQLADRLEDRAESGTVLIGESTHRIVQQAFRCEAAGEVRLRTGARAVKAYRVLEENAATDRFTAGALSPLVGRDRELGLLLNSWEYVLDGRGQIVMLLGEPGIGKSRLLYELKTRVQQNAAVGLQTLLEFRCAPEYQTRSLTPVSDGLEQLLEFQPGESQELKWKKLDGLLRKHGCGVDADPFFGALLNLPPTPARPLPDLNPDRLRERTFEVVVDLLRRWSQAQPLLFVVEDLHWVDPSTLELLQVLVDELHEAQIMVLFTARPEFAAPWASRPFVTQIALSRLTKRQIAELIGAGQKKGVQQELIDLFVDRTDGVPLFIEEMTRMARDAGVLVERDGRLVLGAGGALQAIPETLQDLLATRLDRLGPAKEVAQVGSVLGREFSDELLRLTCGLEEMALSAHLTQLQNSELLFRKGSKTQSTYIFKHALIQDAAYQSLLKARRQQLHQRAAEVYEANFPETAQERPELLAFHFGEAGLSEKAIPYWEKAGLLSRARSANVEAIAHFRKGLDLLLQQPESDERSKIELRLQIPLGTALLSTKGYAAPEVGETFLRAQKLCERVGSTQELFYILWGIWAWRVVRDELDLCMEISPIIIALANDLKEKDFLGEALFVPGLTELYRGRYAASRQACESALALADQDKAAIHTRFTGQNSGVTLRCYLSLALWHQGEVAKALALSKETVALASALEHPFTQSYALHHAAWLRQHCRLGAEGEALGDELIRLGESQRFSFWKATGMLYKGAGLIQQGRYADGLALVLTGLEGYQATGAALALPYYHSFIAEGQLGLGDLDSARKHVDEALALVEVRNDRFCEPELHRLRGVILARSGQDPEPCFRQAMRVAADQGSRSYSLRAALSLASHHLQENRHAEAEAILKAATANFEDTSSSDHDEATSLMRMVPSGHSRASE